VTTGVERMTRLLLAEHAVVLVVLAVGFWFTPTDPFWPWWTFFFGLAGAAVIGMLAAPRSYALFRLAGTLAVVAFAGRCISPLVRAIEGEVLGWRGLVGVVLYLHIALGLSAWWSHAVAPYWLAQRRDGP
jgi:hypothetical protein